MSVVLQEVPLHSLITKNNGQARYKKKKICFLKTEERNRVCVIN